MTKHRKNAIKGLTAVALGVAALVGSITPAAAVNPDHVGPKGEVDRGPSHSVYRDGEVSIPGCSSNGPDVPLDLELRVSVRQDHLISLGPAWASAFIGTDLGDISPACTVSASVWYVNVYGTGRWSDPAPMKEVPGTFYGSVTDNMITTDVHAQAIGRFVVTTPTATTTYDMPLL